MHAIETGVMLTAIILLAVLGQALFVYVWPYKRCRWCRGRKIGRRCWRCKGTKRVRRLGAKWAHKVRLSVRQAWDERGTIRTDQPGDGS